MMCTLMTSTLMMRTLMTRTLFSHKHMTLALIVFLCLFCVFVYLCNCRFTNPLTTMKRNPKNWGESFQIEIWSNSLPKAYSASDNETLCGPCKAAFIMLKYKFEGFNVPYLFCWKEMTPFKRYNITISINRKIVPLHNSWSLLDFDEDCPQRLYKLRHSWYDQHSSF